MWSLMFPYPDLSPMPLASPELLKMVAITAWIVFILVHVRYSLSFLTSFHLVQKSSSRTGQSFLFSSLDDGLSLGAPRSRPSDGSFTTKENVFVEFKVKDVENANEEAIKLINHIDNHHGK